jgi:hypothetical protein
MTIGVAKVIGGKMIDRLETGLVWHRSCESGACVEAAKAGEVVLLRSTLNPEAPVTLRRDEWFEFLAGVKKGDFDDL